MVVLGGGGRFLIREVPMDGVCAGVYYSCNGGDESSLRQQLADCQTILKLTCWVCGTHPATLGRKPARTHRLLITKFIEEVSPLLPKPSRFQDYDRSMFYPAQPGSEGQISFRNTHDS